MQKAKKFKLCPDQKCTGNENGYSHVYLRSVRQYTYQTSSASKCLHLISKCCWSCTRKGYSRSDSTSGHNLRRQSFALLNEQNWKEKWRNSGCIWLPQSILLVVNLNPRWNAQVFLSVHTLKLAILQVRFWSMCSTYFFLKNTHLYNLCIIIFCSFYLKINFPTWQIRDIFTRIVFHPFFPCSFHPTSYLPCALLLVSKLYKRNSIFHQQNSKIFSCHIKQQHVLHTTLCSDQRQSATETKPCL